MSLGDSQLLLETRKNWQIPNEMRQERHTEALRASVELFRKTHPDAQLRSITNLYNCVGMVVASRRTWVDPEDLHRVLGDDGYRMLRDESEVERGDIVVYRDDTGEVCHVGVVAGKNVLQTQGDQDALQVISKWGGDGEYFHGASNVPVFLGKPVEYWTDRKQT